MPVVTIADVLDQAGRFEKMLADYYQSVAESTVSEGVRLLTDYMSRHRERMSSQLAALTPSDARRIRSTPIHFQPKAADCHCLEGVELASDAPADDVLDVAVQFDQCLIRLYRMACEQVADEQTRAFFEGLIRCEERDEIQLKKIKAMDYF